MLVIARQYEIATEDALIKVYDVWRRDILHVGWLIKGIYTEDF